MFSINYLEIGDHEKADKHFRKGFERNIQEPFLLWREVVPNGPQRKYPMTRHRPGDQGEEIGAVNFLTGAGGFLQSILFGYSGLRVLSDQLVINEPRLMPATTRLVVRGVKYRGLSVDLKIQEEKKEKQKRFALKIRDCKEEGATIKLRLGDDAEEIIVDCGEEEKWCKYLRFDKTQE